MAVKTNLPATGGIGVEPPPDAPRERSQPLKPDAGGIVVYDPRTRLPTGEIVDPVARARQNERTLAPLRYESPTRPPVPDSKEVQEPKPVQAAGPAPDPPAPEIAPLDRTLYPAGSDTDTPSRGLLGTAPIPSARSSQPLSITGGWGSAEGEYFPLDGFELKTLLEQLMDELHARIQNDLRFSAALTYPRLTAKVQILIEGEVEDQSHTIEKVFAHDKTPLALAQQYGDSVVFVVVAERREFDEQGESLMPSDAIRDQLGLVKPRKQGFETGGGKMIADINW